jgi:hypothetical protein
LSLPQKAGSFVFAAKGQNQAGLIYRRYIAETGKIKVRINDKRDFANYPGSRWAVRGPRGLVCGENAKVMIVILLVLVIIFWSLSRRFSSRASIN